MTSPLPLPEKKRQPTSRTKNLAVDQKFSVLLAEIATTSLQHNTDADA